MANTLTRLLHCGGRNKFSGARQRKSLKNSALFRFLELELARGQEGVRVLSVAGSIVRWLVAVLQNESAMCPLQKDRLSHGEAELPRQGRDTIKSTPSLHFSACGCVCLIASCEVMRPVGEI